MIILKIIWQHRFLTSFPRLSGLHNIYMMHAWKHAQKDANIFLKKWRKRKINSGWITEISCLRAGDFYSHDVYRIAKKKCQMKNGLSTEKEKDTMCIYNIQMRNPPTVGYRQKWDRWQDVVTGRFWRLVQGHVSFFLFSSQRFLEKIKCSPVYQIYTTLITMIHLPNWNCILSFKY